MGDTSNEGMILKWEGGLISCYRLCSSLERTQRRQVPIGSRLQAV